MRYKIEVYEITENPVFDNNGNCTNYEESKNKIYEQISSETNIQNIIKAVNPNIDNKKDISLLERQVSNIESEYDDTTALLVLSRTENEKLKKQIKRLKGQQPKKK